MFSKILIITVVCNYLLFANAETPRDVINEFRPKIEAEASKIGILIHESNLKIGKTTPTMLSTVVAATNEIKAKIAALKTQINQVEGECSNAAKKAIHSTIDFDQLKHCTWTWALQNLELKIAILGDDISELRKSLEKCPAENGDDVSGLRQCLEDALDQAEEKISGFESDVDNHCANAIIETENCTKEASGKLNSQLNNIENDWKNCL